MKTAIIGSRNFADYKFMESEIDKLDPAPTTIVSGGARGADWLAQKYATDNNIFFIGFPPLEAEVASVGFAQAARNRNARIVAVAERLVAFPMSGSKGTWHTVGLAKKKGIEVIIAEQATRR